jgi:hypothetical protein
MVDSFVFEDSIADCSMLSFGNYEGGLSYDKRLEARKLHLL